MKKRLRLVLSQGLSIDEQGVLAEILDSEQICILVKVDAAGKLGHFLRVGRKLDVDTLP